MRAIRMACVVAGAIGMGAFASITGARLAAGADAAAPVQADQTAAAATATPITHLVVIFDENVSFDHYFGTYPHAANPPGEPRFDARPDTPAANTLTGTLLTHNPNALNAMNGDGAVNPFRLDRSQAATADQHHDYRPEQLAFDHGLMDLFPLSVGKAGPPPGGAAGPFTTKGLVMGYFDGNTVTALWNYAQHFAMSDDSFGTTFGPSTIGAINLVTGQTNGVLDHTNGTALEIDGGSGSFTLIGDADPIGDPCSVTTGNNVTMKGRNIGNLLNEAGVTWGWFQGGFDLTATNPDGTTGCNRTSTSRYTGRQKDYVPHHEPFQYYGSTSNLQHLRPTSVAAIGSADRANHQYDLEDFYAAVRAGHWPAVSFLKPLKFQNGHAGNSDPLDEQTFLVHVLNFLQQQPDWATAAVVIAYDDSDGWYDHVMGPIVNQSATSLDQLSGPGQCGTGAAALAGVDPENLHAQGRCGYGPRLPLLVISPWARENFIDHTVTDQTSIIRFIEDNWLRGKRLGQGSYDVLANSIDRMFDFSRSAPRSDRLLLDEDTGEPVAPPPAR